MAIRALARRHGVRSRECKVHERVIKGCRLPGHGRVALRAIRREIRRDVTRVRRSLKIFEVTTDTGRTRQVVVIVDVAVDALPRRHSVPAAQREPH